LDRRFSRETAPSGSIDDVCLPAGIAPDVSPLTILIGGGHLARNSSYRMPNREMGCQLERKRSISAPSVLITCTVASGENHCGLNPNQLCVLKPRLIVIHKVGLPLSTTPILART